MTWTERNTGINLVSNKWWISGTVVDADVVAVYQPLGSNTLTKSYSNLANPGTSDAAPGVAPSFSKSLGWSFDGATQYLTTGIIPTSVYTILIRYVAQAGITGSLMGQKVLNADISIDLSEVAALQILHTFLWAADTRNDSEVYPPSHPVMVGLASNVGYLTNSANVVLPVSAMGGPFSGTPIAFYIGANNTGGSATNFYNSSIAAIAIYNRQLTQTEVEAITANMLALDSNDTPFPGSKNVTYITQHPSTKHLNSTSHELWIATEDGLFHSLNGGRSWARITLPDPSNAEFSLSPAATVGELTWHWIDYDPTNPSILYALAAKAESSRVWIYKSTDSGLNWISRGVQVL